MNKKPASHCGDCIFCSVGNAKKEDLCEYLQREHTGKSKAVFSKELERLFDLDGRGIRRKISALRKEGHPICSGPRGYYYAANQDEINDTVGHFNEFVTGLSNSRTALLFASVVPVDPVPVARVRVILHFEEE